MIFAKLSIKIYYIVLIIFQIIDLDYCINKTHLIYRIDYTFHLCSFVYYIKSHHFITLIN